MKQHRERSWTVTCIAAAVAFAAIAWNGGAQAQPKPGAVQPQTPSASASPAPGQAAPPAPNAETPPGGIARGVVPPPKGVDPGIVNPAPPNEHFPMPVIKPPETAK